MSTTRINTRNAFVWLCLTHPFSVPLFFVSMTQVQDYGVALKLNDGFHIMLCMLRLLKVLLCLHSGNRQSEYITVSGVQMWSTIPAFKL